MFSVKNISFEQSRSLNNLVLSYIQKKKDTETLYQHYPDIKGISDFIQKQAYKNFDRSLISRVLEKQSGNVRNTTKESFKNIDLLKSDNTYTVITGHQLCLFTGPLYFIVKIFSTINLAEELHKQFPEFNFVPVYWMASEDHDFEEVNHFHLFGKKIEWKNNGNGAVGDFDKEGLEQVSEEFKSILGNSARANELLDLFKRAYLDHPSLKDSTRFLVNELFGKYGLVIADGNDTLLKKQAKEIFMKDIFENLSWKKVNETSQELVEKGYHAQVNARKINCFYLDKGLRARIEKENDLYKIVGTEKTLSEKALKDLINNEPEKISPNVVLRPLYQQHIFPNIAYVGGPGELAYLLEFKSMFEAYNIPFPILVPRAFVFLIDKNLASKVKKLELNAVDFFMKENELTKHFMEKENLTFILDEEKEKLNAVFSQIKSKLQSIDPTLSPSASAEEQKLLKGIEHLEQKAHRALKHQSETKLAQLQNIRQKLFPGEIPQERHENFASFYSLWGSDFLNLIKQHSQALDLCCKLIIEN